MNHALEPYQLMFERVPLGLCILRLEVPGDPRSFRLVSANPAATRMLGYPLHTSPGKPVVEVFPPVFETALPDHCADVVSSGQTREFSEIEYFGESSRRKVFSVQLFPLPDQCAGVIFENITARKDAEATLRKNEASLLQAQRMAQVGSWEVNLRQGTLKWSAETYRIFGVVPEVFVPNRKRFLAAVHADDQERVREAVSEALRNHKPYRIEHRIVRPDGAIRTVTEQAETIFDDEGNAIQMIGMVQDVTERSDLETQLRHVQRMESIGQLAGGVAHDFNNMLTVIQVHASLLLAAPRDSAAAPSVPEAAREISIAAERAANLTRQLLMFGRRQMLQPKNIDLNAVLGHMTKMLGPVLGEDICLQFDFAARLPSIHADEGMMEQILLNLTVNSRDAMPNGGTLKVATSVRTLDGAAAKRNAEARPGQFVCLRVVDTGTGIAPQDMPHIFEPFFTTKDIGKGTGLGLATVYGIVKQHRGWIEVASQPGLGTTFEIFLPAAETPAPVSVPVTAEGPLLHGSETVLLVEDEPGVRQLIATVLRHLGYTVQEATTGREALDRCATNGDQFHLLITDLVMPSGVNGRELAEALQRKRPQLKVLFVSGYSSEVVGPDFPLLEGVNFLRKPFSPQALGRTVRNCLAQSPAPSALAPCPA